MKKIISITIFVITLYYLIATNNALSVRINLFNDFLFFSLPFTATKNQLTSLIILELIILIASILMYRSALSDEEYESRERYENRKRWKSEYTPSSKMPDVIDAKFNGDKDISNDSYKLYLVNKYKIDKNDVFNKYVYQEKMYDSIDEILYLLHKLDNIENQEEVSVEDYDEYIKIKNDCIEKITRNGNIVKSLGEYPNIEWSVLNNKGFRIKKIKSLHGLVNFTNSSK